MPTYEYKCPKCGAAFEVFQRMKARPGAPCPKCGAKAERQLSGGHGLVFKGSGFYATDYKRKEEKGGKREAGGGAPGGKDGGSTSQSGSPPSSGSSGSTPGSDSGD